VSPTEPTIRARRRSTEEVKRLIADAALEVFKNHGFANAKAKDIADLAEVAEPVIFRHYGSKAHLFERVVLESVSTFIQGFTDRWQSSFQQRPHDQRYRYGSSSRAFSTSCTTTARSFRYTSRRPPWVTSRASPLATTYSGGYSALLGGFELIGIDEFRFLDLPDIDIPVAVRAAFGMVLSVAVYGDTIFPDRRHPDAIA
jgi:AcrR family transcriptional regulator